MSFDPASALQDYHVFGECGDINPSITDSSTYTFLTADTMKNQFAGEGMEGCYLYSRHWSPMNRYLADALAAMESTEDAHVTASGMGAITSVLLQLCGQGDEIVSSRTIYGGTWAFMHNVLPRWGIRVRFVDTNDLDAVAAACNDNTRIIYTETMSNPLLAVPDIQALARVAKDKGAKLVVDNTFTPMLVSPARLGADVVVHSITKFINGASDTVAGCICADKAFIDQLADVNSGACMLLGPVLDGVRAASILKNLRTLHVRMQKHSANAAIIAARLESEGLRVAYPGLDSHPDKARLDAMLNPGYGHGGMLTLDAGTEEQANTLCRRLQEEKVGYLAVSLGYVKTLFSPSGNSTSSEIPADDREAMGLTDGLIRFSIGLDHDIDATWQRMRRCLQEIGLVEG